VTKWRSILAAVVLSVGIGSVTLQTGCAAPTLPIPPPTALVSAPDATGLVTVTGHADPMAYVFVLNENTEQGIIVHADPAGAFTVRIAASLEDAITVWQMIGNEAGQQLHLVVMP
jgi:hypothetical protein